MAEHGGGGAASGGAAGGGGGWRVASSLEARALAGAGKSRYSSVVCAVETPPPNMQSIPPIIMRLSVTLWQLYFFLICSGWAFGRRDCRAPVKNSDCSLPSDHMKAR